MTSKKQTSSPTEADLESAIHNAIKHVFAWLPDSSVRHQTRFSFNVGRRKFNIDGAKDYQAEGRADIILYHKDKPLAVLELKRNGIQLTTDDTSQGLSYAKMLVPSPPLVIVTNGDETRIFEAHTGELWTPTEHTEKELAQLVKNASQTAKADLRFAVDTLMGTNAQVWRQALQHVTSDAIAELTGSWNAALQPFVTNFLIPRHATVATLNKIEADERLVLVEGAPMSGKSNVLRELAAHLLTSEKFGTLFVEAGVGRGVYGIIADALAAALDWPVTAAEARDWLVRVSQAGQSKVVLLVDGFIVNNDDARKDIEDLSSLRFGNGLAVVVAMDDSVADMIVLNGGGRRQSTIGRRAKRVRVGSLSAREFNAASRILRLERVTFMNGAQMTPEYRRPWVLRAVAATAVKEIEQKEERYGLALPPFQGMELIRHARKRFDNPEQRRLFSCLAFAVLDEIADRSRKPELVLQSVEVFVVRDATAAHHIDNHDRALLAASGFAKPAILADKSTGLVVQLPELLACELVRLLEEKLISKARNSPEEAARWLADTAALLPFGDVIAATSAFDAAQRPEGLNSRVINALLDLPPVREAAPQPGSKFSLMAPGGNPITLTLTVTGAVVTTSDGHEHEIELDEIGEFGSLYDNHYPWLILSYLAELPFIIESNNGKVRADMQILLEVGEATMVLRKMGDTPEMQMVLTLDGPDGSTSVACKAGIIEPITFAIFQMFMREEEDVDEWMDAALARQSSALLHRIHTALHQAAQMAEGSVGAWAKQMLSTKIGPALQTRMRMG